MSSTGRQILTPSKLTTTNVPPSVANLQTEAVASFGTHLSAKHSSSIDGKLTLVVLITGGTTLDLSTGVVSSQLAALKTATGPGKVSGVSSIQVSNTVHSTERPSPRSREMEFLGKYAEKLAGYVGQWVALEGEIIVAHGSDPVKVVAQARKAGVEIPFIFRVQPKPATNEGTLGL
jgi:Family of unknown function (DUF5678)